METSLNFSKTRNLKNMIEKMAKDRSNPSQAGQPVVNHNVTFQVQLPVKAACGRLGRLPLCDPLLVKAIRLSHSVSDPQSSNPSSSHCS